VPALFRSLRASCARAARLVFTFIEPTRPGGRLAFRRAGRAVDAWLALRGEPFRWGATRAALAEQLAATGFRPRAVADADALRRRYLNTASLARLPLAEGECICVAEAD
jgi:O-methyltransferase involved in polyketide biosynthesis